MSVHIPDIILHDHFPVNAYAWHELAPKLLSYEIRNILGSHLILTDYEAQTKMYWLRMLVMLPSPLNETKPPRYFSKKQGILYDYLELDCETMLKVSIPEAHQMQAEAYLQAILKIPTIRGMKKRNFQTEKFYADVRQLFQQAGWVV